MMYKVSDFPKPVYKAGETANFLGVTTQTLHRYDALGKLKFFRSEGGHRLIKREDLLSFLADKGMLLDDMSHVRRDVIYLCVDPSTQDVDGVLNQQAMDLIGFQTDLQNPLILKEVGDTLDAKRPVLQQLIRLVLTDQVHRVFVSSRDQLAATGYDYLEYVFQEKGVSIQVIE